MTDLGTEGLEANGANRIADIAKMSVHGQLCQWCWQDMPLLSLNKLLAGYLSSEIHKARILHTLKVAPLFIKQLIPESSKMK